MPKFENKLEDVSKIEDNFLFVDLLFSKKFLPNGSHEGRYFLAYLLKSSREGHLCVQIDNQQLTPSFHPDWDAYLIQGALTLPESLFEKAFVKVQNRFYLKRNWECEKSFLFHCKRLKSNSPEIEIPAEKLSADLDRESLQPEQRRAILEASSRTLSFILGGPGTGKTYTAKVLVKHFSEVLGIQKIALAAPTGKAAGNLRTALKDISSSCTIQTLHALLKKRLLSEDIVLVDEGSMIDAEMMTRLFAAIKDGARLIILGDPDQLPPVESGNFFADLSAHGEHVSWLKTCLRAELQDIIELADNVKKGRMISFKPLPSPQDLLEMLCRQDDKGFRALTPVRKGAYGVESLNEKLFEMKKNQAGLKIPIMIKINDSYLELYNGDTGILDQREGEAWFGERKIPEFLLPRYELAYVHSIHKSQGSEYDEVWIILGPGAESFGREMLYTAITRAKKKVEIFAEKEVLEKVLSKKNHRLSGVSI